MCAGRAYGGGEGGGVVHGGGVKSYKGHIAWSSINLSNSSWRKNRSTAEKNDTMTERRRLIYVSYFYKLYVYLRPGIRCAGRAIIGDH